MPSPGPLVIAHRGACGYLPEHTLAAKALAHGMGADFIEQDVVLTRDGVPIVLHDIFLDSTTDVARQFPGRARPDGHYHAVDFSLEEVRRLHVHERRGSGGEAVYPQRFPTAVDLFRVPTLGEELDLIAGLDHSRGRRTGLYVELKSPNRHRAAGLDLPAAVLAVLAEKGYADRPGQVFLQCFDDATLRLLRDMLATPLPLVQLIADPAWGEDSAVDFDYLRTAQGLDEVATYADAIGPWLSHIYLGQAADGSARIDPLVQRARERGLAVHPYTFRRDDLPAGIGDFDTLLDLFIGELAVDGLFTDFPDLVLDYLARRARRY
ncbi:MAG: glycerophosphodiester phosphodiesterase [Halioglobus sp.]|nr:glycerophosphodiester phosphodiesterase [Halioglobus sp.]